MHALCVKRPCTHGCAAVSFQACSTFDLLLSALRASLSCVSSRYVRTRGTHTYVLCRRRLLFLVRGSFAGCFLDKLGKKRALRPPRSHGSRALPPKRRSSRTRPLSNSMTEFIDLFDAVPLTSQRVSGVLSLSSSKPLRLRIRRNLKPSPRC